MIVTQLSKYSHSPVNGTAFLQINIAASHNSFMQKLLHDNLLYTFIYTH